MQGELDLMRAVPHPGHPVGRDVLTDESAHLLCSRGRGKGDSDPQVSRVRQEERRDRLDARRAWDFLEDVLPVEGEPCQAGLQLVLARRQDGWNKPRHSAVNGCCKRLSIGAVGFDDVAVEENCRDLALHLMGREDRRAILNGARFALAAHCANVGRSAQKEGGDRAVRTITSMATC